ncbi:hypothetical protein PoB_001202500 [Plakobranchus ocellatus]|uniref:Uncharacterized protein n=1 Tax=Plakobranchus ocellatus TaxID=259542 RepID=A0AAV3YQV8_9GAST|nr:hypothetical protein PoB_001202500 [Plakobranchus ocellatus]
MRQKKWLHRKFTKRKYREAKLKRNRGERYVRPKTKIHDSRKMGKACVSESCLTVGRQCGVITLEQREEIFQIFYGLGNLRLQREFIVHQIDCACQKTSAMGSSTFRPKITKTYYLTIDRNIFKVWQKMFLNALGISEKTAKTAIRNKLPSGAVEAERGETEEQLPRKETKILD